MNWTELSLQDFSVRLQCSFVFYTYCGYHFIGPQHSITLNDTELISPVSCCSFKLFIQCSFCKLVIAKATIIFSIGFWFSSCIWGSTGKTSSRYVIKFFFNLLMRQHWVKNWVTLSKEQYFLFFIAFHFIVGLLGEAHELMVEALNLFHSVYGPLHVDIATCYRYLLLCHQTYKISSPVFAVRHKVMTCRFVALLNLSLDFFFSSDIVDVTCLLRVTEVLIIISLTGPLQGFITWQKIQFRWDYS